ncbi:unannotated protein [freshwater metagenome]|uniref:Unannotated protein n=1 Tax=freshwater metagenome TaxID=449393 RepID=A0A6J7F8B1_9ZZZZ|nr:hypothetical protein [Actinomycetota bacterium]
MTTGNFKSFEILDQEASSAFEVLDIQTALEIGEKAVALGIERKYPITISIELDGSEVFRQALPGASYEHAGWITRKSNVVNLTHHSTMYERVKSEEDGIDWHQSRGVVDETHAIHGGGFPLINKDGKFRGVLLISGLPQVEDHLFAAEVLNG